MKQLLETCIQDAKANLMNTLLCDVNAMSKRDGSSAAALRQQVWRHAASGELDEPQVNLELRSLDEAQSPKRAKRSATKTTRA